MVASCLEKSAQYLSMCFVSIGYALRVQAGQAPVGVHSDDRDYKRWSEPPIFRIPAAGYKTSSVDRGRGGRIYPAQEDHTIDSKPLKIHSRYPVPETHYGNVPKTQNNHFKSGSVSLARRRSNVVYNRSGNKAFVFPDGKKFHQGSSNFVFSTGAVQVPPRLYRPTTKLTGGFSPVQVHKAPVGLSDRIHAGGYHPAYAFPKSFNPDRANMLQKVLKSVDKKTDSIVEGHPPASSSAGQADAQMSYPLWRPRVYNSDVTSEARGYAHVRRIKPVLEKTQPQASSAAGRKFLESGFPFVNQGGDSTKGFGLGVPALNERRLNLNHNSRGSQPSSWHPPSPDRAQVPVQGKFKPFERLPTNDLPALNHSDHETAPTQTSAGTTRPPSMYSTGITSTLVPMVTGEMSTKSASPMQTEGRDMELVPQPSNHEGHSERSTAGPSWEQNKPFTVFPPKLQPAEKEGKGDRLVSRPLEKDHAAV